MNSTIQIQEAEGLLVVRSRARTNKRYLLIAVVIGVGFFLVSIEARIYPLAAVVILLVVIVIAVRYAMVSATTELRISSGRFVVRGGFAGFAPTDMYATSDVRWLEYRGGESGPETESRPGGLYAQFRNRSVCILPYIGEPQCHQLIDRISGKFPELARQWQRESYYGEKIISLGIGERE